MNPNFQLNSSDPSYRSNTHNIRIRPILPSVNSGGDHTDSFELDDGITFVVKITKLRRPGRYIQETYLIHQVQYAPLEFLLNLKTVVYVSVLIFIFTYE